MAFMFKEPENISYLTSERRMYEKIFLLAKVHTLKMDNKAASQS